MNKTVDLAKIHGKAQEVLYRYKLKLRPSNVVAIIEGEGLELIEDDKLDCVAILYPREKIIKVNPNNSLEEILFQIAHALGHWFMHDRDVDYYL